MADVSDLLERARARAPAPTFTLNDLHRRRDRRRRARRAEALLVGLTLAVASIGVAFLALRERAGTAPAGEAATNLPPASQPPLVAGPGQYYYAKSWRRGIDACRVDETGTSCHFVTIEAETWWATDESGRVLTPESDTTYESGEFPHDTITTGLPTDPGELQMAMFDRSGPNGASPEPQTTVSPGQDGMDASVEQSIVNLLDMPNVTPALRAGLLEVLAGMHDVTVDLNATDPVGRPAYRIRVTTFGGPTTHDLYVDPATHELLAHVETGAENGEQYGVWILEAAGLADSTRQPAASSILPAPTSVPRSGDTPTTASNGTESCSQGGPDLKLIEKDSIFDTDCLEVEAGAPFTIEFHNEDPGMRANVSIYEEGAGGTRLFRGEPVVGPDNVTYRIPGLDPGRYVFRDDVHPALAGTLIVD